MDYLSFADPSETKWSFRTVIALLILVVLTLSIPVGVFLVERQQLLSSKAAFNFSVEQIPAQTSFILKSNPIISTASAQIELNIYVRSDKFETHKFVAKLNFPSDLLKVESLTTKQLSKANQNIVCGSVVTRACNDENNCKDFLNPCEVPVGWIIEDKQNYFIDSWSEQSFDNQQGVISLVGSVGDPGFKTTAYLGQEGLMASVVFSVKENQSSSKVVAITFDNSSAIFDSLRNLDVLEEKKGIAIDLNLLPKIQPVPSSPAPSLQPPTSRLP
ncbi:hypothetical protein HYS93_01215 [Candidatus Daviesbacteria bacterium]|nr:hypothetical protein [Candidatus Daviesbacteria bacterium]